MARAIEAPAASLTWRQVKAWRLRRQFLDRRVARSSMLEVAGRLCGLHAQLLSSAELTLWARVDDLGPDDVSRALWDERTLVKTWAMRGTLHLLAADEYPLWQAALSTYRHFERPAWLRAFGVTADELDRLVVMVGEALDGDPLTRTQLAAEVGRRTGSPELGEKVLGSWGALLKPASFKGRLCFAPGEGQNVRFTRPDRWLRGWRDEDPTAAMAEVTRRFLAAYGPASREDFGRWWGLAPAPAGRRLAALGDAVVPVEVDGARAWMLAADVGGAVEASPVSSVRLLPAFDQYVIGGTAHVANLLPRDFKARVHRPQGWVSPVLLVDGRIDGVWRHERKGKRLLVRIEPFIELSRRARRGAEEEAERLAAFLGGSLDLSWA